MKAPPKADPMAAAINGFPKGMLQPNITGSVIPIRATGIELAAILLILGFLALKYTARAAPACPTSAMASIGRRGFTPVLFRRSTYSGVSPW